MSAEVSGSTKRPLSEGKRKILALMSAAIFTKFLILCGLQKSLELRPDQKIGRRFVVQDLFHQATDLNFDDSN